MDVLNQDTWKNDNAIQRELYKSLKRFNMILQGTFSISFLNLAKVLGPMPVGGDEEVGDHLPGKLLLSHLEEGKEG